ncbi:NUDIX hydrolase [Sphaerisporangium sp. TRM90804]|uniref:NUDIX hydrolase n=1 Tax=Sphaerisporangium sp. TRM90804 TaxID=3031113 RepID=UPI0024472CB9|nr:NUDIX hydrolase [Sphaerisporangium sp. TRM90804]MDH2426367.1 NUDIX hydrolase [Sphaerisporangium sp. TRM90804]
MEEPLAVDEAGDTLTTFHRVAEHTRFDDAPLPAALTALWHDDRMLLVFDRFRQSWELPGGRIDPGETPRQAAVRELREETGLQIENLFFAGYARFMLGAERREEYAAIYVAFLTDTPDTGIGGFVPNDEISAIRWWDGVETLPGGTQVLDVVLARLARDTYLESLPDFRALPARDDTGDEGGRPHMNR